MRTSIFVFACMLLFSSAIFAQEPAKRPVPRMQKNQIPSIGCAAYMPGATTFDKTKSEDGSEVYTGEVAFDGFNFAVICVKFAEPLKEKEGRVDLLTSYMDFLQGQFEITGSAGYGKGHTLDSNPNAEGVIEYWEDSDGNEWAVKGWIDGDYLAVLCMYGKGEYPYYSVQEMFLNGFRFPEE